MANLLRRALPWCGVLAVALVAMPAQAQRPRGGPARTVQDEAGFFSPAAIDKANAEIAELRRQFNKDFMVETVPTVKKPENLDFNDKAAVNRFFDRWAIERYKNLEINGIYAVIVKTPKKIRIEVGPRTMQNGLFTAANRDRLFQILRDNLEKNPDQALLEASSFVHKTIAQHSSTARRGAAPAPAAGADDGPNWTGLICIGLLVLAVVWLLIGLMRRGSGAGMAGAGGGGGGGFLHGLLGGMFGAMAGMWLYNNFFGGHTPSAFGGGDYGSGYDANTDVGAGDPSTGGGDYGDDGGGGGGGDWGGGGDAGGGGGDWGGGGGGGDW